VITPTTVVTFAQILSLQSQKMCSLTQMLSCLVLS